MSDECFESEALRNAGRRPDAETGMGPTTEATDLGLTAVIRALRSPAEAAELAGEVEAMELFRAARPRPRRHRGDRPWSRGLVVGTIVAGALVAGGAAAAATGRVPAAAASLSGAGPSSSAPGAAASSSDGDAGGDQQPDVATPASSPDGSPAPVVGRGGSTGREPTGTEGGTGTPAANHGAAVSDLARTTDSVGREKGQEVAEFASGGRTGGPADPPGRSGEHRSSEPGSNGRGGDQGASDQAGGTDPREDRPGKGKHAAP